MKLRFLLLLGLASVAGAQTFPANKYYDKTNWAPNTNWLYVSPSTTTNVTLSGDTTLAAPTISEQVRIDPSVAFNHLYKFDNLVPYIPKPVGGFDVAYLVVDSSYDSYKNFGPLIRYAKVTSTTANTVSLWGICEAAASSANCWANNPVGLATASGATAIADETDASAIVSGALAYGLVLGCTGYYPCQSAVQIQANRWAAPWANGIFFNTSSTGEGVSADGNLITASNATRATYAIKLPGIYQQEMYLPSLQVGATPTNKLVSATITGNGTTAIAAFVSTVNFPWVGSTMTLSGYGNAGFNTSCTVTAASATSASCLNGTNASSSNGAVTVANPTITVTSGSLSSGTCTLGYANAAAVGYPAAGSKVIVSDVVATGNSSGQDLTGYNGNFTVVSASTTQITYACPLAAGNYVSGGTIAPYPVSSVVAQLKVLAATAPGNTMTISPVSAGQGSTSASILFAPLGTGVVELGTTTTYADASGNLFTAGPITSSLPTGTAPFSIASTTNVANLNASLLNGATFAAPGSIGSGTPGSGAFTTLTSSSGMALTQLATQATNTVVGNATSGTAVPTALAVGTCSTSSSALNWTSNTGFGCNTSINAATLGSATFAAPGAIGSGTPSTVAGTNVTSVPTAIATTDAGNVPFTLISSAIPFIFNTCTLNGTGAISACATMPSTYANAYMFFNAAKLAASGNGSAAGFYYVQMSSATAGQACTTGGVFTLYSTGSPTVPASCVAPASGVAVGANTIPATIMLGPAATLIAHSMGKNGSVECHTAFSQTNSANTRTLTLKFGTATILMAPTTVVQGSQIAEVVNAGSEAAQVSNLLGTNSTTAQTFSTQPSRTVVDTGSNVTISWNQTMNTSTEFYVLERYSCRVWPN